MPAASIGLSRAPVSDVRLILEQAVSLTVYQIGGRPDR